MSFPSKLYRKVIADSEYLIENSTDIEVRKPLAPHGDFSLVAKYTFLPEEKGVVLGYCVTADEFYEQEMMKSPSTPMEFIERMKEMKFIPLAIVDEKVEIANADNIISEFEVTNFEKIITELEERKLVITSDSEMMMATCKRQFAFVEEPDHFYQVDCLGLQTSGALTGRVMNLYVESS